MPLFPRRKPKQQPHRYSAHQVAIPVSAASVKALAVKLDGWQAKVLRYADLIPEVMTGYNFVHNTMDMVTFEIQRFDRHDNEWVSDETPQMQGIERRINLAFRAGRAAALGHLIEEVFILVSRTPDNGFCFETLAATEIRTTNDVIMRRDLRDGQKLEWVAIDKDTTTIRVYTPDPADRHQASGPHKALLGLLETMALELSRDQADAISVLAGNGILYIPTEILPDEVDTLDASTTPGSRKGFEEALEEAMILTIADRQRGDAVMPITLYGPAEYAKDIRHILPTRAETAKDSADRMDRYVQRYARSIDLPSQVILGIGDANHWGDWKVDENTWAYHLKPRGQRIADALYDGLVRKIICNLGFDSDQYRLVPDAGRAIAKSDISRVAIDAYKLGAITPEAFVEAVGFDPSDMRVDAEEALLCLVCPANGTPIGAALGEDAPPGGNRPERTAASTNPEVILRQASKITNAHQTKLENIYRRLLTRVADDAARDGKRAKAQIARDKTAADEVPFLGYQPGVYFAKYAEDLQTATNDELFAFLRRFASLLGMDYRALRSIWAGEFKQRGEAVARQAQVAAESVGQRSFKSGKPTRVSDNVIRTLSSTANGGSNESNGAAGNTQRPTHAAADPVVKDTLGAVVSYATKYTWKVGHPERPYLPHQRLENVSWFSWQEFDKLDVPDADAWLLGSVYFPGDHDGCRCEYDIEFVAQTEAAE